MEGSRLNLTRIEVGQAAEKGRSVDSTTREWLVEQLHDVLEIAMGRVTHPKTLSSERIKWSRIVIAAGQALNAILRDVEIESLKQQITELRALTTERLSTEQEIDRE